MAWEDELEPDWVYELPFYLVATIAYGALLTVNPTMRWGTGRAADAGVPIEFVVAVPLEAPSPNLAPPPSAGEGRVEPPPRKGDGDFVPEKIRAGAQDKPLPLEKPVAKPAAVKSTREKHGSTIVKRKPKAKPVVAKTVNASPKPVDMKAIMAASIARRAKVEHSKAVKAAAAAAAVALAERKAEEAREAAEVRAEIAREKAAAAHAKALAAKEAKARRDAKARADAQVRADAARARAQALADARAAKAAKKAELSQELATMTDPDNALAQDADSPAPAGGPAHHKGNGAAKAGAAAALAGGTDSGADDVSNNGAALAGARKAGAAAALADTAESKDPGDAAGSGGAHLLDAKAKGGGVGPDGAGVSYSLEGPVGSRRVLKRAVPSSPDWVGARGLDLTVTVRFQVLPDGTVKPGAVIRKTSGFPEIDRLALNALRKWRFESVTAAGTEVWGRVTFRFTS
jgi:TonB family protein